MGMYQGISGAARTAGLFGGASGSNVPLFGEAAGISTLAGSVSGIVGTLATTSVFSGMAGAGAISAFGAMAGPIGLALAGLLTILTHIFSGADPNQVPAAQIEQCFEAAADNMRALMAAAYLSAAEATLGMQRLIQAGDLYYQQAVSANPAYARDSRPFTNGQTNMTRVINAEINNPDGPANFYPIPLIPWNEADAQALYIQDGAAGWYSGAGQSIDAATALTNGFMEALRAANPVLSPVAQNSASSGSPVIVPPPPAGEVTPTTPAVQTFAAAAPLATAQTFSEAAVAAYIPPTGLPVAAVASTVIGSVSGVIGSVSGIGTTLATTGVSNSWIWVGLLLALFAVWYFLRS